MIQGINLLTRLWTDGDALIPVDYRLYDKSGDGLTKNDRVRALLAVARERAFQPTLMAFDSRCARPDNLKAVWAAGWHGLTQLAGNRLVTPPDGRKRPLADCPIAEPGTQARLQGYESIRVFRFVTPDGATEHWATSD